MKDFNPYEIIFKPNCHNSDMKDENLLNMILSYNPLYLRPLEAKLYPFDE